MIERLSKALERSLMVIGSMSYNLGPSNSLRLSGIHLVLLMSPPSPHWNHGRMGGQYLPGPTSCLAPSSETKLPEFMVLRCDSSILYT